MPPRLPLHIRRKKAKGRVYHYFDTGTKTPAGKPILERIIAPTERGFGNAYAAKMSARSRRAAPEHQLLVPDLVDRYTKSDAFRKLSVNTQHVYGVYLNQLAHAFNAAPAEALGPKNIYDLIDTMGKRPAAANMVVIVARILWKWGRSRKAVTNDPAAGVDLNEGGEHEPWPDHVLEAGLATDDASIRVAVAMLYYTAQRIGDVCAMRWSDIRDGVLYVTQEKTGTSLEIPIHRNLAAELSAAPRYGITILAEPSSRAAKRDTVRRRLQRWAVTQGAEIVPHGLRKNAVNALLEAGCTVGQVSSISGHSLKMVEHYAKRRNNRTMATAAILTWERNGTGKTI